MINNNDIQCLVVDDEPLARETIEKYINDTPGIVLAQSCQNAFEAIEVLSKGTIDLIFLDINMPKLSGINMLKTLEVQPLVIFTTAYSEYAVDGFELDATDYLLKPFSFERFIKAVNKAKDKLNKTERSSENKQDYLMLKSDKKMYKIDLDEIQYIQAFGDYVKVVCLDKTIVSHSTMKKMQDELPSSDFFRIHKSYIVAIKHISLIEGNQVKIGEEKLPIGISYKEKLLDKL